MKKDVTDMRKFYRMIYCLPVVLVWIGLCATGSPVHADDHGGSKDGNTPPIKFIVGPVVKTPDNGGKGQGNSPKDGKQGGGGNSGTQHH